MVTIRADEISNIIHERVKQYNREVKIINTGTVLQVGDEIAQIYGLDKLMAGELVEFEEGTIDIALNLESNNVGVVFAGTPPTGRVHRARHPAGHPDPGLSGEGFPTRAYLNEQDRLNFTSERN